MGTTKQVQFPRVTEETLLEMGYGHEALSEQEKRRLYMESRKRIEQFKVEQPILLSMAIEIADFAGASMKVDPSIAFSLLAAGMSLAKDALRRQMEKGE